MRGRLDRWVSLSKHLTWTKRCTITFNIFWYQCCPGFEYKIDQNELFLIKISSQLTSIRNHVLKSFLIHFSYASGLPIRDYCWSNTQKAPLHSLLEGRSKISFQRIRQYVSHIHFTFPSGSKKSPRGNQLRTGIFLEIKFFIISIDAGTVHK